MCYDLLEDYLFFKPEAKHREHKTSEGELAALEDVFTPEDVSYILENYPTAAYVYYDFFEELGTSLVLFLLDGDENKLVVDFVDEDDLAVSEYSGQPELHRDLIEMWKKHVHLG